MALKNHDEYRKARQLCLDIIFKAALTAEWLDKSEETEYRNETMAAQSLVIQDDANDLRDLLKLEN